VAVAAVTTVVARLLANWSEWDERHRRVRAGLALVAREATSERSRGDPSDIEHVAIGNRAG